MENVNWYRIDKKDNCVVALIDIAAGTVISLEDGTQISLRENIPYGHKFAPRNIACGEEIIKYGASIGHASCDIPAGAWIHTHNLETNLDETLTYSYQPVTVQQPPRREDTFQGFVRENGSVGIRNEIWIIPTVGCVNQTCRLLAQMATDQYAGRGIDGFYALTHPYGCSQVGEDHDITGRTLTALMNHPNAAGVLVVGLGCENNYVDSVKERLGDYLPERIKFMITQEVEDEISVGMNLMEDLVNYAGKFKRSEVSCSNLKIGLKCGGSDAYSGITANPLIGCISDRTIDCGGTSFLTEVPEMFGAELRLMERAQDRDVFDQIVSLINNYKEFFIKNGQHIYDNPSYGNKQGGITTLEEKSLGCTYKAGSRAVRGVLDYGEIAKINGLNLVRSPGNDMVAITALLAAGAQMILFSTGRGNPLGSFVPTLKIGTNRFMSDRKNNWIDYNAGKLLENVSMEQMTDELWEMVLKTASGEYQALNEVNNFRDFTIFKTGVTE